MRIHRAGDDKRGFFLSLLSFYRWNGENMLGTKTTRKWRVLRSLFSVIHKAATRSGGLTPLGALFPHFSSISGPWTRFRVIAACIFPWERFPWEDNKVSSVNARLNQWRVLLRMRTKQITSFEILCEQSFFQLQPWFLKFWINHNRFDGLTGDRFVERCKAYYKQVVL